MAQQLTNWLFDPKRSFAYNLDHGPFGDFDKQPVYKNVGEPSYDFFGTKVYSPFGIAAGPLPRAHFVKAALDRGYDLVTFKTVRTAAYPCHPSPNVHALELDKLDPLKPDKPVKTTDSYTLPLTLANSFGIPSFEPSIWQPEIRNSFNALKKGQALLVAFQGTLQHGSRQKFIEDHVKGIGLLLETGATLVEVNLSCPNEGHSNLLCFDVETTKQIIESILKIHNSAQLIVKISHFNDDVRLKKFVQEVGPLVAGITAINTIGASIVDDRGRQAFKGPASRLKAGVSGTAIKHLALDMVRRLKAHRAEYGLDFKIIGIGGVQTAGDFHEYRASGADFVMSLTGVMWNPNLAAEIKQSLQDQAQ